MDLPLDITNFLRPARLFSLRSYTAHSTIIFMLSIFGAMILAAIIIKIIQKSKPREKYCDRAFNKHFALWLTFGLVGMALVWFRFERVYFLSGRFWTLIWFLALLLFLYQVLKYQVKVIPEAKKKQERDEILNKYIPASKKQKNKKAKKQRRR